jgi:hypothetical protein
VYDVTSGGERFLITIPKEQSPTPLVLVTNWQAAIVRR